MIRKEVCSSGCLVLPIAVCWSVFRQPDPYVPGVVLNEQLARAFLGFHASTQGIRILRARVSSAVSRWKNASVHTCLLAWFDHMKDSALERKWAAWYSAYSSVFNVMKGGSGRQLTCVPFHLVRAQGVADTRI